MANFLKTALALLVAQPTAAFAPTAAFGQRALFRTPLSSAAASSQASPALRASVDPSDVMAMVRGCAIVVAKKHALLEPGLSSP